MQRGVYAKTRNTTLIELGHVILIKSRSADPVLKRVGPSSVYPGGCTVHLWLNPNLSVWPSPPPSLVYILKTDTMSEQVSNVQSVRERRADTLSIDRKGLSETTPLPKHQGQGFVPIPVGQNMETDYTTHSRKEGLHPEQEMVQGRWSGI